jgi:hypothetical protein
VSRSLLAHRLVLGVGLAFGLGLFAGAERASGQATLFALRTGPANPLESFDLGDQASPALADFDGDGDLDVVVARSDGAFRYLANTGTAAAPSFVERVGPANPLAGATTSGAGHPAAGDLDGDGDLDLVAGSAGATTYLFYENVGTSTGPAFGNTAGVDLAGVVVDSGVGDLRTASLVDLDGDGDLDLVAGGVGGDFRLFENVGTASSFAFVARTGAANPLAGFDVGTHSGAVFGDLDRDGDPDLVSGNGAGSFVVLENAGGATAPAFVLRSGGASPLDGVVLGALTRPALGDLDADGDLDLITGQSDGTLDFLENRSGLLLARTGAENPLAAVLPGSEGAPAFGDLDGDGDADLIVGAATGTLRLFANTGSATNPAWVERTGAANPLAGQDVGTASAPSLGDLDADGDLDLVVGEGDGVFGYFETTGSAAVAVFVARIGSANPLDGQSVGSASTPSLGDLDRDGDLDLVAGGLDGALDFFENTGSRAVPAFVLRVGAASPVDGISAGSRAAPALGDADADGDLDLLIGTSAGTFMLYENTSLAAAPVFAARTGAANPLDGEDVGSASTPAFVDLDGDGDVDVACGETSSVLDFWENTILEASVGALELWLDANPFDGFAVAGSHSSPALADLDGDGDLDLVAGAQSGLFTYLENTGSATRPVHAERFGAAHPLDAVDVGAQSAPAVADLDGDGDPDVVSGRLAGSFAWLENTGTATDPLFVVRTGAANPLAGGTVGLLSAPAFGDLDADGDFDLVAGDSDGVFAYFENVGTRTAAVFAERSGTANPLSGFFLPGWSAPALGDLDRDGDLDLLAGDQSGQFSFFENTGTAKAPLYAPRTGAANPLDAQDVGSRSAPSFGDLDRNGTLDLVTGNHVASFQTWVLPEPGRGVLFAAGIVLLVGWARRRRRPGRGLGAHRSR